MIEFKCHDCGKVFRVKDSLAGREGKCPACGAIVAIPDKPAASTEDSTATTAPNAAKGSLFWPVMVLSVCVLLLAGVLTYAFVLRDTWETDHFDQISQLAETAKQQAAAGEIEKADATCKQLFDLIGPRTIERKYIAEVVAETHALHAKTDADIRKKQELERERKRRLEEEEAARRRKSLEDERRAKAAAEAAAEEKERLAEINRKEERERLAQERKRIEAEKQAALLKEAREQELREEEAKQAAARKRQWEREHNVITAEIEDVANFPERYVGKCVQFDHVKISGDIERNTWNNGVFRVPLRSQRDKYFGGFSSQFVTCASDKMADALIHLLCDNEVYFNCSIACEITCHKGRSKEREIHADIYKITVYNRAGRVALVFTEEGLSYSESDSE